VRLVHDAAGAEVSRIAVAAAVLAVAAIVAGTAGLVAGARDDGARAGSLAWAGRPRLVTPPRLPRDRILYGQVRNDGPRDITLTAGELRVVDAAGRRLKSDGRFLQAFARGGRRLTLAPGRTAPLTVAWRGAGARRVTIGDVVLRIPR
jgi:hypothetical protein